MPGPAKRAVATVSMTNAGAESDVMNAYFSDLGRSIKRGRHSFEDEIILAEAIGAAEDNVWLSILAIAGAKKMVCEKFSKGLTPARKNKLAELAKARGKSAPQNLVAFIRKNDDDRVGLFMAMKSAKKFKEDKKYYSGVKTSIAEYTRAKNEFVEANLRLTISIAKTIHRRNNQLLSLADMISEGNLGLFRAVERYDHTRGFRFSTYAAWWIRHAINRALSDRGRTIRIPVHVLDAKNLYNSLVKKFIAENGREPTAAEIKAKTGWSDIKFDSVVSADYYGATLSLDATLSGDGEGKSFIEVTPDNDAEGAEEFVIRNESIKEVSKLLDVLNPMERTIINKRFGFGKYEEHTLVEIASQTDKKLSRERIRQLQEVALDKLRKAMKKSNVNLPLKIDEQAQ